LADEIHNSFVNMMQIYSKVPNKTPNKYDIIQCPCRSVFIKTTSQWDPISIIFDIFKRMLLNHYPTTNVPPYYFTGPRKLHILHTRLRTESSCLKYHILSKKNMVDSTTCQCGLVENYTHYLL